MNECGLILMEIAECMRGFEDEIMNKVLRCMSETMNRCYSYAVADSLGLRPKYVLLLTSQ